MTYYLLTDAALTAGATLRQDDDEASGTDYITTNPELITGDLSLVELLTANAEHPLHLALLEPLGDVDIEPPDSPYHRCERGWAVTEVEPLGVHLVPAKRKGNFGFEAIPKPVCTAEFEDFNGNTYGCHRAAPYWTAWHIHRNTQNWWIGWNSINWIHYRPLRKSQHACWAEFEDAEGVTHLCMKPASRRPHIHHDPEFRFFTWPFTRRTRYWPRQNRVT